MSNKLFLTLNMNHWPPLPKSSILLLLILLSLSLSSLPPSSSSSDGDYYEPYVECSSQTLLTCGSFSIHVAYPFTSAGRPDYCGHPGYHLYCTGNTAMIDVIGMSYVVKDINYPNSTVAIADPSYAGQWCPQPAVNTSLNFSLFYFSQINQQVAFYVNCNDAANKTMGKVPCLNDTYFNFQYTITPPGVSCGKMVVVGMEQEALTDMLLGKVSLGEALEEGFVVGWTAGLEKCVVCLRLGGVCGFDNHTTYGDTCYCPYGLATDSCPPPQADQKSNHVETIAIGVAAGFAGLVLACLVLLFFYRSRRKKLQYSYSISHSELSIHQYETQIFTYKELEEATNGFSASQELGDGGFSSVYKGKLRDGRTVAVKRFYDSRHAEQFRNEVDILSSLRHPNLVTLYGSTSFHSSTLLLVYECMPNGTLDDHLHGSRESLGWPTRMRVAIEIADALSYLHSIEPQIVHRDVKTSNILLDDNFHVKVSDFGLSRLFPVDASYVSTAPMGTPGYVDPEYQSNFQLTDKSDVYSFGVVLAELVSSKSAFDIQRNADEVKLANVAVKKILNNELDQFVDQRLGYHSDISTKRMIDSVAELALRCLQMDINLRPSMKEVLEVLKEIDGTEKTTELKRNTSSGDCILSAD